MSKLEVSRRSVLRGSTALAAMAMLPVKALAADGTAAVANGFTAGAVYFRKSNPPSTEWDRDYGSAHGIGLGVFRHWFMWSAIEVAPGTYDWADYDLQLDLAARHGLKTIISIIDNSAPEWAFETYAASRFVSSTGKVEDSVVSASSETGGTPGLCLDNEDVRAAVGRFITALVERYRNHPALLGYDVWNETSGQFGVPDDMYCFCNGTRHRLHDWLKGRYGDLAGVNKAWHRYSYTSWDQVAPPRGFQGYADSLDWLEFRIDNAYALFDWRLALIRGLDPHHLVVAHGTASTLNAYGSGVADEWRAGSRVDVYGTTWIASRMGSEAWRAYQAYDLTRAGAGDKPFWHAEATGGPLWLQRQLPGRPREDGREPDAQDVRLDFLVSLACGAKGLFFTRFRGLLDGPLFDAFGLFGMDGSMTPQAAMAGEMIRWIGAHPEVSHARPVQGDVAILFAGESELFNVVLMNSSDFYATAARGAYRGFFDNNVQADFILPEQMSRYRLVYIPFPVMLKSETVAHITAFITQGGTVVCEGFPAYFGDHGHVGESQPNYGLDAVFGCRQAGAEFAPDLSENLEITLDGAVVHGRYFRQDYTLAGGQARGRYADGTIAAVESRYQKGKALLVGSFLGAGYAKQDSDAMRTLYAGFLDFAGIEPSVRASTRDAQVRLHEGNGHRLVWVTNATGTPQTVSIKLEDGARSARDLRSGMVLTATSDGFQLNVGAKDGTALLLL